MPDELASQLPLLKELLTAMGVRTLESKGYEADDILGTLARACTEQKAVCYIATGDRDSLQLVSDQVTVLLASTKAGQPQVTVYTPEKIKEEFGLAPSQLIDVKALQGDASDHIPGVAGVGQKTALDLIQRFGSVDTIYEQLDTLEIRDTLRAKLRAGEENARMSYRLGKIVTDVPVETDLSKYLPENGDRTQLAALLRRLEFYKWIEKWGLSDLPVQQPEQAPAVQASEPDSLDGLVQRMMDYGHCDVVASYQDGRIATLAFFDGEGVRVVRSSREGFGQMCGSVFSSLPVRTHDVKSLYHALDALNIEIAKVEFDTLLAGYLLNPSASSYDLSRLAQEYGALPVVVEGIEDEVATCAAMLPGLCAVMEARVDELGQKELLHQVEIPLARVLADMERAGFLVDEKGIAAFGEVLEGRIADIQKEIYTLVGYEFNLNSPKQLAEALFVKLGLTGRKKTKSGYSTNAEVLEELRHEHPAVGLLLEYRELAKLKSTYCDGMVKAIGEDGRIHSTLNQTETRTGRISSTEPNLQNIPQRKELGRELRRFFVAKPGCVLCDADYSQIELRVLAHVAGDQRMIEAFRQGTDIHTLTASQVFGMPPEMVTPLMRTRAKAVNFGIVYGIGAFSLANDLGISFGEAKHYINSYMNTYTGVRDYMERTVEQAKQQGWVQTLFGRRRYLPELSSSNANLRAFGERVARNMPIQGTAADIIKIAMVHVYRRLKKEGLQARLIMQVHDELIVEAPQQEEEAVCRLLREEMENAVDMQVDLIADVHTGRNWYDAKG